MEGRGEPRGHTLEGDMSEEWVLTDRGRAWHIGMRGALMPCLGVRPGVSGSRGASEGLSSREP